VVLRDDVQGEDPETKQYDFIQVPGKVILWQWLSLDRFFPGDQKDYPYDLRGCSSDYENSSSYKIISEIPLPLEKCPLHMHRQAGDTRPLFLVASPGVIRMITSQHFTPCKPPPFPGDESALAEATQGLSISEDAEQAEFPGWVVRVERFDGAGREAKDKRRIEMCSVGGDGKILVAVGEEETMWIWHRNGF